MKLCPTCKKTFIDQNLSFCIDDGTPLVTVDSPSDEPTLVRPSPSSGGDAPPPYEPPRPYTPPDFSTRDRKRKVWPWVVAVVAIIALGVVVLVALVVTGGFFIQKMAGTASNDNSANYNANVQPRNGNLNASNSNTQLNNQNGNDNSTALDTEPAPTDEGEVLSDLTDLEHEWTVANINADKKKLDHILADDYVGITEGKSQGKAEYLKTIERDTNIQKWDFEDLKVNLKGDRATLTGIIRLDIKDEQGDIRPVAYRFTDKFVWRDGRWQATGSEVNPIK
jgi:ketosteroid isomerase-like protein